MNPLVLQEQDAPFTVVLTLNRPEKRNALSLALMEELCGTVEKITLGRDRRILILRGAGNFFCSGLDLQEAMDPKNTERSARMVAKMLLTVHQCSLATIAAVEGGAVGGGAGLMSACDFVVAGKNARIGYPETRRGLVAALVVVLLKRQLGERRVRELLFTGEPVSSERAMEIGLINRVAPAGETLAEAKKIAALASLCAPGALQRTKRLLEDLSVRPLKEDLKRALKHHLKSRGSTEAKEGIAAFLENRPPQWQG